MKKSMTQKERFQACWAGKPIDRLPRIEWAPWWQKTIINWQSQGLPVKDYNVFEIQKHFKLDPLISLSFSSIAGIPSEAHQKGYLCTNEQEYKDLSEYLYRKDLQPFKRLCELANMQSEDQCAVWLTFNGFFWHPRTLFGIENHFYSFYDYPELLHRMNRDQTEYIKSLLQMINTLLPEFSPVFVTLAEDMSYNHGSMLSKKLFDEFLAPYYREILPALKEFLKCPIIIDSDGLVDELIPWLLGVGADGILPLERRSGVDANLLREKFPNLLMIGNYDKTIMNKGEKAICSEFERLLPVIRSGKFIPSVDHQTPPEVSIQDYSIYRKVLDEYTLKIQ